MTTATTTEVEAQQERSQELRDRIDEKDRRKEDHKRAQFARLQKRLEQGGRIADNDLELASEVQDTVIVPAAKARQASRKHTEDVGAFASLGDRVLEPTKRLRKAADEFAEALAEVRPLLRQFASSAHKVNVTVQTRFATGSFIQWELEATLYRAWPGLFTRPRAPQLLKSSVGELIERSVATAVKAARRTLNGEVMP